MMKLKVASALLVLAASARVPAQVPDACHYRIGVSTAGELYADRFNGWYKISQKTLEDDLRGGCYNDANPLAVSGITLELSPSAPKTRITFVYSILARHGWSFNKVDRRTWTNQPHQPDH